MFFAGLIDMQGCQLLRFGRSLLRFPSLTTPENTPSKNYAQQKFRSETPIPWRNGEYAETTGTSCTLVPRESARFLAIMIVGAIFAAFGALILSILAVFMPKLTWIHLIKLIFIQEINKSNDYMKHGGLNLEI